jgi:hypothetical protein
MFATSASINAMNLFKKAKAMIEIREVTEALPAGFLVQLIQTILLRYHEDASNCKGNEGPAL